MYRSKSVLSFCPFVLRFDKSECKETVYMLGEVRSASGESDEVTVRLPCFSFVFMRLKMCRSYHPCVCVCRWMHNFSLLRKDFIIVISPPVLFLNLLMYRYRKDNSPRETDPCHCHCRETFGQIWPDLEGRRFCVLAHVNLAKLLGSFLDVSFLSHWKNYALSYMWYN